MQKFSRFAIGSFEIQLKFDETFKIVSFEI